MCPIYFVVYLVGPQPQDAACDQQALNLRRPLVPGLVLIIRVGQNRIFAPYMTECMVISLLKYRMYTVYTYKCMVLANPSYNFAFTGNYHETQRVTSKL